MRNQKPKIIIPIVAITKEQIINQAKTISKTKHDIIEWRADHYNDIQNIEQTTQTLTQLKTILTKPILFTLRTAKEGGQKQISNENYKNLYKKIIETKQIDLIDIEIYTDDNIVTELINTAHKNKIQVIASSHNFNETPQKEEIIKTLIKMDNLNADILKIAVMPNTKTDVLELLQATDIMTQKTQKPLITISMGKIGMITRLCGQIFGSYATFASVEKSSAPGQIDVEELEIVLDIINRNLNT